MWSSWAPPPTTNSMVTDRPVATDHACSTSARCCSHLVRWVAFGTAMVTEPESPVTTSTGVYKARAIPLSEGHTWVSHSRVRLLSVGPGAAASVVSTAGAGAGDGVGVAAGGAGTGAVVAAARARPPSAARPVAGSTGPGPPPVAAPPATACSSWVTRAASAPTSSLGRVGVGAELDQRDLDEHPWIGGVAQLDEDLAEPLDAAHDPRRAEPASLGGELVDLVLGQLHQLGRHQRQEPVAQVADQRLGEGAGLVPGVDRGRHGGEGAAGIVLDEGLDELLERKRLAGLGPGAGDQLERRQRVAGRAAALLERGIDGFVAEVEAGVGDHPADVLGQRLRREEVEAQVLGAAADRLADPLGVGGGEDEHDVRRRLFERLQQGSLGRLGQHVDLVEDVHLVPAGRAERRPLDEVAHRVDPVVARRIELVDVVAGAALDGEARGTLAAGLAVDRALAVEDLGEDAGRARLARAAGPGEEVGLAFATAGDGVAQRPYNVVLPLELGEPARAVAAIERGRCHRAEPSEGVSARTGVRSADGPPNYRGPVVPSRTSVPRRTLRLFLAAGIAALGLLAAGSQPARAQNTLEESDPADGAVLSTSPSQIVLTFTEAIGDANLVAMACGSGGDNNPFTDISQAAVGDNTRTLTVEVLEPIPPGTCQVSWQVSETSGEARHRRQLQLHRAGAASPDEPRRGAAAGPTTTAPAGATGGTAGDDDVIDASEVSDGPTWLGRVLSILGVAVLFGALVLIVAAWPEGPEYIVAVRFLRAVWLIAFLGTLFYVVALTAAVNDESFGNGLNPSGWLDLLDAGWAGRAAIARLVLVVASGWVVLRPERVIDPTTQLPAIGIPALAVVTLGLSRTGGEWAIIGVIAGIAHALAMAIWVGAVVLLARVVLAGPGEEDLVHAVRGFARISGTVIVVTVVSGLIQLYRLDGGALFSESHGQVLLLKTLIVAAMVFVALTAGQIVQTRLARANELSVPMAYRLRRAFGTEAVLGVVVIALSGWLLSLDPEKLPEDDGVDFAITEDVRDPDAGIDLTVSLDPGRVGAQPAPRRGPRARDRSRRVGAQVHPADRDERRRGHPADPPDRRRDRRLGAQRRGAARGSGGLDAAGQRVDTDRQPDRSGEHVRRARRRRVAGDHGRSSRRPRRRRRPRVRRPRRRRRRLLEPR